MTAQAFRTRSWAGAVGYPLMIAGAIGLFLWVRSAGSTLNPLLSTSDVPFTVSALFLGVSLSVTAFPDLVVVLFLPAFFAFTGMRTEIGLVHGASQWLLCGVILATASLGKFGGTFVAARITGFAPATRPRWGSS